MNEKQEAVRLLALWALCSIAVFVNITFLSYRTCQSILNAGGADCSFNSRIDYSFSSPLVWMSHAFASLIIGLMIAAVIFGVVRYYRK